MQSLHEAWRESCALITAEDEARADALEAANAPRKAAERAALRAARVSAAPTPTTRTPTTPTPAGFDLHPDFSVADAMADRLEPSRRADGWTAERQRGFCAALSAGASVENAARSQGLSPSSSYAFRNSAKGAAFAVGWTAAQLLQRQRLADTVAARAFEGQTLTITRPDGTTYQRHHHDNRLAMNVLARLDRLAAGQAAAGVPDLTGEGQAARLAAAEFDRYLDVLADPDGGGGGPARAGLFLAARVTDATGAPELAAIATLARADLYARTGAGVPAELDTSDLDPAARADWTAAQWARAEAAGLLTVAPAPARPAPAPPAKPAHAPPAKPVARAPVDDDDGVDDDEGGPPHSQLWPDRGNPVWHCAVANDWRTYFPPGPDWCGEERGLPEDEEYERDLSNAELAAIGAPPRLSPAARAAAAADLRDAWFADIAADIFGDPADADASLCDDSPTDPAPDADPASNAEPGEACLARVDPEDAGEDRVDMLEVIGEVEIGRDRLR